LGDIFEKMRQKYHPNGEISPILLTLPVNSSFVNYILRTIGGWRFNLSDQIGRNFAICGGF
jgi:hypothetical protein